MLRFDGSQPVQSWGFQGARFIAERQETDLWAYFPRDVATPIAYLGRLDELRGLKGGGALELVPFGVGYARRHDGNENMLGSGFKLFGSAGLNLKWHLANDVTLDARVQSRLRAGRGRSGDPEPDQLRDLPAREAAVFPGGHRRVFVPACRSSTRGASAAAPTAPTVGTNQFLADVPFPATIYGAGKLVGRLGPALDDRRAQRRHRPRTV